MKYLRMLIKSVVSTTLVIGFFAATSTAQERGNDEARTSPNASISQTIGTTIVSITYGRPGINDRPIFGKLVPFNRVWRTGANESTAITFSDDVTVGGQPVKAGTYSLYTIPGEDEWTVIINSKMSWGTEYDKSQDVARIKATPEEGDTMEQFMIYFENVTDTSGDVVLHWEDTRVPFTIQT